MTIDRQRWWHVTNRAAAAQIVAEGLQPNQPSVYSDLNTPRADVVYLATHLRVAAWYWKTYEYLYCASGGAVLLSVASQPIDDLSADEDAFLDHPSCCVDNNGLYIPDQRGWSRMITNFSSGIELSGTVAHRYFGMQPREHEQSLSEWASGYDMSRPELVRYSMSRGSVAVTQPIIPDDIIVVNTDTAQALVEPWFIGIEDEIVPYATERQTPYPHVDVRRECQMARVVRAT